MSEITRLKIDERAVVEDGSIIGEGTSIWHFSHIRNGSEVGENCVIGKSVYVDTGVKIGDQCKIQNNVSIYNGVTIGDSVFVGPHVVFTNDLNPRAHIWDSGRLVKTRVDEGASIGANATIRCGITIGQWCMVAAGAVVTKDVPPHALVVGVPGKIVDWVTKSGERLNIGANKGLRGGSFVCQKTGEAVYLQNRGEDND